MAFWRCWCGVPELHRSRWKGWPAICSPHLTAALPAPRSNWKYERSTSSSLTSYSGRLFVVRQSRACGSCLLRAAPADGLLYAFCVCYDYIILAFCVAVNRKTQKNRHKTCFLRFAETSYVSVVECTQFAKIWYLLLTNRRVLRIIVI